MEPGLSRCPGFAGRERRDGPAPREGRARSGVWVGVSHTHPPPGEWFRAFVGSPGERATHSSFDHKGRCVTNTTTGIVTFSWCCHFSGLCLGFLGVALEGQVLLVFCLDLDFWKQPKVTWRLALGNTLGIQGS